MTSTVDTVDPAPTAAAPSPPDRPAVPRLAQVLGAIGRTLITGGIVVLLFAAYEVWGTNFAEARAQNGLRDDFDVRLLEARDLLGPLTTDPPQVIDAGRPDEVPDALPTPTSTLPGGYDAAVLAYFFPEGGEAVARIEIPAIGVDKIVVNGVQVADLRKGPGYYPSTALVGNTGNTAIAGHRTTYGAPFGRIDELEPGDEIFVTGVLGRFSYRVMAPDAAYPEHLDAATEIGDGHTIVRPSETWVLGDFDDDRLTLTACHPKYSARRRIIVAAELVGDPISLPEWAAAAAEAAATGGDPLEAVESLGADEGETTDPDEVDPGLDGPSLASPNGAANDLDEGLDGERDAIPGAVAWMVGAIAFWVLGGVWARRRFSDRRARFAVRLVALMPALLCLWFSFELIDRALPAA